MPQNNQQGLLGQIFGDKYTQSKLGGILGQVGNVAQSFTQSPSGQYFAARAAGADPNQALLGQQRAQAYQTAMAYQEEQRQREAEEYKRQQEAAAQAEAQQRINQAIYERIGEGGTGFLGQDRQQQVAGLLGRGMDAQTANAILGKEQSGTLPKQAQLQQYRDSLIAQGNTQGADEMSRIIAKMGAMPVSAATVNVNTGNGRTYTKGEETADKEFGKEYQAWLTGGFADSQKSIEQLKEVSQQLGKDGANLTGPGLGSLPDSVKKFTNPQSIATRESVEEIVQRNLRLVLGAQFTEKEGERLIKRAYNPNLSEAENKKRVDRLIKQIEGAAKAKQAAVEYFQQYGTLQGFDQKVPSVADLENAIEGDDGADQEGLPEGARLAPDGNYYIQKADGWYKVEQQ